MDTALDKKLDELIAKLTQNNKEVQEKKESGPWGWVVGLVIALISLVGIGVAMYLVNKRAKELAEAKTKIEQDKVDQDQKAHEAQKEFNLRKRNALMAQLEVHKHVIQKSEAALEAAAKAHAERKKKIENLNAWSEINEA